MIYWDKHLGPFSIARDYGNSVVFFSSSEQTSVVNFELHMMQEDKRNKCY